MKVALGTFARRGIESQLGSEDVAGAVLAALCHYRHSLEAGRPPLPPPAFLAQGAEPSRGARETLEVPVDPEVEAALVAEAHRHGVGVEQIAAHGILVYLAELDFLTAPPRPL